MIKTTMFQIPVKTVSESNSTEHWLKKSKRHKLQKWLVKSFFKNNEYLFKLPVIITLTRIAPKMLDEHDNLRISVKWIVDQLAAEITGDQRPGLADDNKEITWQYGQRKGMVSQYAVEIKIEEV